MLIEALAEYRVVEHKILTGATLDIDRTLAQFLNRRRSEGRLLLVLLQHLQHRRAGHASQDRRQPDAEDQEHDAGGLVLIAVLEETVYRGVITQAAALTASR